MFFMLVHTLSIFQKKTLLTSRDPRSENFLHQAPRHFSDMSRHPPTPNFTETTMKNWVGISVLGRGQGRRIIFNILHPTFNVVEKERRRDTQTERNSQFCWETGMQYWTEQIIWQWQVCYASTKVQLYLCFETFLETSGEEKSTSSSPCTNRPVVCTICNTVVWSYIMTSPIVSDSWRKRVNLG